VDREEIERQDFPAARRGYDPAAVEAHLRRVADEFDAVARQRPGSLAEGASTQVRAILEAAETSARQLRDDAGREASEHVERVEDAAQAMLGKLDGLQTELDRLLAGLKATAETLTASLEELSRDVGTLGASVGAVPGEPPADEKTTHEPPAPPAGEATPAEPPAPAPAAPPSNGARSDDEPGARLVALNMALEGTPRDETARFLDEHYALPDLDGLLDDVYASAGR
jgi:DivIVA domain-containing protein